MQDTLFEHLSLFVLQQICCRKRVNASVTRGGLVRTGGDVRATLAPTGRTGRDTYVDFH